MLLVVNAALAHGAFISSRRVVLNLDSLSESRLKKGGGRNQANWHAHRAEVNMYVPSPSAMSHPPALFHFQKQDPLAGK